MNKMSVIHNDTIRMANLCMIGSHSVNGVSKLHSDIIKQETLLHLTKFIPENLQMLQTELLTQMACRSKSGTYKLFDGSNRRRIF